MKQTTADKGTMYILRFKSVFKRITKIPIVTIAIIINMFVFKVSSNLLPSKSNMDSSILDISNSTYGYTRCKLFLRKWEMSIRANTKKLTDW